MIAGPLANIVSDCTFDGIKNAQKNLSMVEVKCSKGRKGNGVCSPTTDQLVQYLAAAEEYTYLHCMFSMDEASGGGDQDFVNATSWPEMDYKLGAPNGPAVEVPKEGSGVWRRGFATGAWVEWDNNKGHGEYYFPGHPSPSPPPSPSPSPPPPPPPPPSPSPPVQPTSACPVVQAGCSRRGHDRGRTTAATWGECCVACGSDDGCESWVWSEKNAPHYCHLHGANAKSATNPASVCGSKPPQE